MAEERGQGAGRGPRVLIDGEPVEPGRASVSVFDHTVLRGAGCFEAFRAYGGRPFALDAHLGRLTGSAQALHLPLPPRRQIRSWVKAVASAGGDCIVRVLVTSGGADPFVEAPSRTVVLWHPLPEVPAAFRLYPVPAPWHPAGAPWPLTGVKSLSYGPNVGAQQEARKAGFDDALLIGREGQILEAPTSSVAWVKRGVLETPGLELGILASITREVVLAEAGRLNVPAHEGTFSLERLGHADEVMILATSREVSPVTAVGAWTYAPGPVTEKLAAAYRARVVAGA